MLEISPEIYAPSYPDFLWRRLFSGAAFTFTSAMKYYLICVGAFFFLLTISPYEVAAKGIAERVIFSLIGTFVFLSILIVAIAIPFYFLIWKKKWLYGSDEVIIVSKSSSSTLSYQKLQKIVLDTPRSATLVFGDPNSTFVVNTFWYGNGEKDWLEFIKFITAKLPSVEEKIRVQTGNGFPPEEIQLPPLEAYRTIVSRLKPV